ncbi:phosphate ABC transporter permease subunit PstC [Methylovorus sp. MM2]|uniref:phosphate ABC transporter permease subunit PstC n=1 Tax=Methylovorus sp. MM2 TaxID=1848038 RepID=UPI0007DE6DD1|nr:phosphate ABC transporter permease subunit PstC [Methylovorus sp. MM2]OAM53309.1 phosphate ABC transporter permease subunit PstC [Methylovorus sp. MM2]
MSMANKRKVNLGAFLDKIFRNSTMLFAFLVFSTMFAIMATLFIASLPALKVFGSSFFLSDAWNPVTVQFGGLVPIFGTLVTAAIAMLIGIPVSFGIAMFITELSPTWLKRPLGIAIELLAGIPSIIYGMWGLFVFAPFFADHGQPWINDHLGSLPFIGVIFEGPAMGIGMLTAGIILAIMVIPFTSSVMRDVFEVVPPMLKESAYGLGATTWEVLRNIVLPYTKIGVVGGIMLGLGRALGETMAVTFVIGNAHELSASLLMPGNTISSALANEFTEAVGDVYTSSLITLGMTLFVITFIVLAFAKLLLIRLSAREGKQS